MASRRAAEALRQEAAAIARLGTVVVFVSTHCAREAFDDETRNQQFPDALAELSLPTLVVLIDPMLEDPPAVVEGAVEWTASPQMTDCWERNGGRVKLLGLRLWVSEDTSRPLGELSACFDVPVLCRSVLECGGMVVLGCTGHVRALWDSEHPNGIMLPDPWRRLVPAAICLRDSGKVVLDESKLESCCDRCGVFHYPGPSASAL
eukprot:gnl/TRDRNA2_/TRDRNA2_164243_c0_seq3.p1 gnl/TRDRNA2_/TRDRNA2_164243_c0~~gnl/TRDRNA2_/TRDRNA2_164243_c0_seq3.p1  ORF type:complete len:205 (+),score=30.29 gnl/TRDRNA2_/TRDRNA2_164243_c0_seq3:166-780(+)